MKKLLVTLVILSSTVPAFALREYHMLHRNFRALGMGGANYALSDDESALFYNPAGLSMYGGRWQLVFPINATVGQNAISKYNTIIDAFQSTNDISEVVTALEPLRGNTFSGHFGFFPHYLQQNFAIGLLIGDTKANFEIVGGGVDTELHLTALSDSGLFVGYGREVAKNLHIGMTAKVVARAGGKRSFDTLEIAQSEDFEFKLEDLGGAGAGFDFDLGAIYEIDHGLIPGSLGHRIGLTFSNILATNFPIARQNTPPRLPRYVSLGTYTIFKGIGPVSNFIFLLDFADWGLGGQGDPELGARGGSFWKKVNLGLEMPMGRLFALRTGFRQGNFSLGMGLNLKYLKLDLAWWGEELGHKVGTRTERRIGMRLVLGGGDLGPGAITENSLAEYRRRMRDTERAQDEAEKSQGLIEDGKKKGAAKELVDRLEEAGGTPPAEGTEPPASGGGAPEQGGTPSEGSGAESDSGQTESGDETGESP